MTTTLSRTQQPEAPLGLATGCPDIGIYIACLASYNDGLLYGYWLDLEITQDAEDIKAAIQWVIDNSPTPGAEEYAIHDSSGLISRLSDSEWPDIEELAEYAGTICSLPEEQHTPYRLACEDQGELLSVEAFEECYRGSYDSPEAFCQELAEEQTSGAEMGFYWSHIDWQSVWREYSTSGFSAEFDSSIGEYHIFCS